MSIFKITESDVHATCVCGVEKVIPISELLLQGNCILLPCDTNGCNGTGSILAGSHKYDDRTMDSRSVIAQTLARRLFESGKVDKAFSLDREKFSRGKDWKKGDVIEVEKVFYTKK